MSLVTLSHSYISSHSVSSHPSRGTVSVMTNDTPTPPGHVDPEFVTFQRLVAKWLIGFVIVTLLVFFAFRLVTPQLNLYKANTEKQSRIAESRAKADAAKFEAEAEVARARGVAEANTIIAGSLTPDYLRYVYITEGLATGDDKTVVYVPTEGLLPITEAGRLTSNEDTTP